MTSVTFASESGIGSALAVVKRLLAEKPGENVWFFYGHGAGEHPEALEYLFALKNSHVNRLALGVVTERESDEADLLSGQLDGAKVQALASTLFNPATVHEYIVCGSDSLAAEVSGALSKLGVEQSRIRVEHTDSAHTSHPVAAAAAGEQETQVSFVRDGRRRSFVMRTGEESILDAAARAGIELPFSCKAGVCATCRTKLVKGKVELAENYALEDWELEQGFILACQARAQTPEIELNYDET